MRTSGPWAGDRTVTPEDGGRRVVRVRYSMEDTARLLWREKGLMILVFVVLLALGALAALTLPKTYTASSRLLVQLGQEYVYQPRAGDAGRGVTPTIEDVVLSELEILQSNELKRRVVKDVGLSVVDRKLAQAFATAGAAQKAQIEAKAVRIISGGLGVHAPPKTGAVRLTFEHKDPESSALILNSLVSQYLLYRKEVFGDRTSPAVSAQRAAFEDRLREADGEYQTFLQQNGIGDFPAEKASLTTLYGTTLTERFAVEARLREAQGRLAGLQPGIASTPAEVSLQRDIDLSGPGKLTALRIERQDLLSRYRPDSQPVRDVDAKIAELERLIASGGASGEKDRRLGANPVWQDVEKSRIQLEAEVASLIARRAELTRQVAAINARQLQLTRLESEYQNLAVEREVLQTQVRNFATRESETRAERAIAAASDDNIKVIERATVPARGESLRRLAFAAALLFAAFTALCVGLLRVFTRKGFATAGSAERTLELPVLARAPLKAR